MIVMQENFKIWGPINFNWIGNQIEARNLIGHG